MPNLVGDAKGEAPKRECLGALYAFAKQSHEGLCAARRSYQGLTARILSHQTPERRGGTLLGRLALGGREHVDEQFSHFCLAVVIVEAER